MRRLMILMMVLVLVATACSGDSEGVGPGGILVGDDAGGSGGSGGDDSGSGGSGGGDDSSSSGSGGSDGSGGGDDSSGAGSGSDFCGLNDVIQSELDGLNAAMTAAMASGDWSGLSGIFSSAYSAMQAGAQNAPAPIRGDVQTLVTGYGSFIEVMEEYDYNFLAVPEDDPRVIALQSDEYDAAGDRVNAYCGFEDEADDIDLGDSGTGGGAVIPNAQMAAIIASALNIDQELAECIVVELGLTDPTAFDPTSFSDLSQEICGTTFGALLGGG